MTKWNNLRSLIRKQGILKFTWLAFRYILRHILRIDWDKTILLERSLEEPIQEIVPKIKVSIEQATEDDLPKFKEIVDEHQYDRIKLRFKKGRICFMALDGKKIIGYCWVSLDDEYEPDSQIEVKLKEGEAYAFDGYVLDEYRKGGIAASLLARIWIHLQNSGCKTGYALVGYSNIPARKAWRKTGIQGKQTVTLFTIFGLKFHQWQRFTVAL